jgi:hypothetical protein
MVHIPSKIDPLDAIKQGEHCVEDMRDIEVLIEMVERRRAEVTRLRTALELIADCDCADCADAATVAREALERDKDG